MKSDDQNLRVSVTREIRKVRPLFAKGVEDDNAMVSYERDFFTRSIKAMQNYQDKHRVVFCKACAERVKYGRRIYRRLFIELDEDLLGNTERVLHAQCFKCGFDMFLPAEREDFITSKVDEYEWNRVRGAFYEIHLDRDVPLEMIFEALQRCAHEYEFKYQRGNMSASEVAYRQQDMQRRMSEMQRHHLDKAAMQAAPPMFSSKRDDALDAMRYLGQIGALSSARTAQAKRAKKK